MKKILPLIFSLAIIFCIPITANAGVVVSDGRSNPPAGSDGGAEDVWRLGTGSSLGLSWTYFTGDVNWTTSLPSADKYGGTSYYHSAIKWASVQKHTYGRGWENFRWVWLFGPAAVESTSLYNLPWYPRLWYDYGRGEADGALYDPELVQEAANNGSYYYPSERMYRDGNNNGLDIVFIEGKQVTDTSSVKTLVSAKSKNSRGITTTILKDRYNESAESLYNSPTTKLNYTDTTKPEDINYTNTITSKWITVTRKKTYMTDGSKQWNISYSYSKSSKQTTTKKFTYKVTAPTVTQTYYWPKDLNNCGDAPLADIKKSYPKFNLSAPSASNRLKANVNSYQDKTNAAIKTLDLNLSTKFQFQLLKHFGFPSSQIMSDKVPGATFKQKDGTYKVGVIADIGKNGTVNTGVFNDGSAKKIKSNLSKNVNWSPNMKATLNSAESSLTFNKDEKLGLDPFTFKDWTKNQGGDFYFKTVTTGKYNLASSTGKNWWEIQYEQGMFYGYGLKYSGTITIDGISAATVDKTNLYARLASKVMFQPAVQGKFEAKTVGGSIN